MRVGTRRARAALLGASSLLLGGCNQSFPNPFTNQLASHLPANTDTLVFASDLYATSPNGLLELYALGAQPKTPTRLTFCNGTAPCSVLEASFAPDRIRAA